MAASLKYQFFDGEHGVFPKCYKFGQPKHAEKIKNRPDSSGYLPKVPWVYSDRYKESMADFVLQFIRFLRTHYPEVKLITYIKTRHFNHFLAGKTHCSTETIRLYVSHIKKLESMVNYSLKESFALSVSSGRNKHSAPFQVDWHSSLVIPLSESTPNKELRRVQQMSRADLEKIYSFTLETGSVSKAVKGWQLTEMLGLRVQGAADIRVCDIRFNEPGLWGFGYACIREKGGRYREIDIRTAEFKERLRLLCEGLDGEDRIAGISADGINKALNRILKALKLKWKYPQTATHCIRKLYAEETFCWVIDNQGYSKERALMYVNAQLGHSEMRDVALGRTYIRSVKKDLQYEKSHRHKKTAYDKFK